MIANQTLQALETAMKRKINLLPKELRAFTKKDRSLARAVMVTGHRGIGKTTFLLHHSQDKNMLYLSADHPSLAAIPLYDLGEHIFMQGYDGIIIDEVHFAKDWSRHVKVLYDDFPDKKIWISDSSSLILRGGAGDLSRRFVKIRMPLLSFREYIALETKELLPAFNPFEKVPFAADSTMLRLFQAYRQKGTRPFYQEEFYAERMLEILDKTLFADVPFFIPKITDGNIRLMKAVIGTLASSAIPRLHVRSLCADWQVSSEKLYQLLFVMESIGVIRIIRKVHDKKAKTVGDKMFLGDPAYYSILNGNKGTEREALAAAMLIESGIKLESAGNEQKGDFIIDNDLCIEIGGRSKQPKEFDFVVRDDIDTAAGKVIPLWALGFMY